MEFLGSPVLTNVLLVAVAVFLGLLCVASKMLLWMGAELLTRFDPGLEAFVLSPINYAIHDLEEAVASSLNDIRKQLHDANEVNDVPERLERMRENDFHSKVMTQMARERMSKKQVDEGSDEENAEQVEP